jgi:hypothetical protein
MLAINPEVMGCSVSADYAIVAKHVPGTKSTEKKKQLIIVSIKGTKSIKD